MCRQAPSCRRPGSLQSPSTSALLPHQLVRLSRALPQGSTPSNPFSFGFCICSDQLLARAQFPAAHVLQNLSPSIRLMFSSKKCSSSNTLSLLQPALTLLVHNETTLFLGFSYHTIGESFQEVPCSKINLLTVLWFALNHLKNKSMLSGPSLFSEILLGTIL